MLSGYLIRLQDIDAALQISFQCSCAMQQAKGSSMADQCSAHMYAAEALSGLGEASRAMEHLTQALQQTHDNEEGMARPGGKAMKATVLANMAAVRAACQDFEEVGAGRHSSLYCTGRLRVSNHSAPVTAALALQATQLTEEATQNGGSVEEAKVLGVFASICLGT